MKIKALILTALAATMLTTTGALARDRDRDGRPDHSWAERHDRDGYMDRGRHDRYWHEGYRGFAGRDVFFASLRAHRYTRWDGAPYWYQGRYVIRTYDRFGRVVFAEMNPYTGAFIGVIRF